MLRYYISNKELPIASNINIIVADPLNANILKYLMDINL